jgi:hypothetical protein
LGRYPGDQLPIEPCVGQASIEFSGLLFNLRRVRDVMNRLDTALIERHGQNDDWQNVLDNL